MIASWSSESSHWLVKQSLYVIPSSQDISVKLRLSLAIAHLKYNKSIAINLGFVSLQHNSFIHGLILTIQIVSSSSVMDFSLSRYTYTVSLCFCYVAVYYVCSSIFRLYRASRCYFSCQLCTQPLHQKRIILIRIQVWANAVLFYILTDSFQFGDVFYSSEINSLSYKSFFFFHAILFFALLSHAVFQLSVFPQPRALIYDPLYY